MKTLEQKIKDAIGPLLPGMRVWVQARNLPFSAKNLLITFRLDLPYYAAPLVHETPIYLSEAFQIVQTEATEKPPTDWPVRFFELLLRLQEARPEEREITTIGKQFLQGVRHHAVLMLDEAVAEIQRP